MTKMKTVYLGGLRTEAEHLQSGNKLITDAPLDNNGKGEFFSPTDLLATSLGSCMLTIMGISAPAYGYNLDTKEGYEENKEKVFGLVAEYLDSGDVDAIDLFNELQEEMTRNGFLKKMFEREVEKATEQANTKN
jgi:hypothetical protein